MRRYALWVVWMVCWLLAAEAWACPGCKESLFDPGELPQRLSAAKGYALSIALLLGTPVILLATVTGVIVRAARRKRAAPTDTG